MTHDRNARQLTDNDNKQPQIVRTPRNGRNHGAGEAGQRKQRIREEGRRMGREMRRASALTKHMRNESLPDA